MKMHGIALSLAATFAVGYLASESPSFAQDGDELRPIELVHRDTASRYANQTQITRVDAMSEDLLIAELVRAGRIDPKSIPIRKVLGVFEMGSDYFAIVDAPDLVHVLLGDKAYADIAVHVAHIPNKVAEQADSSSVKWARWKVESIHKEIGPHDRAHLYSLTIKPRNKNASLPFNAPVNLAFLDSLGMTLETDRWRFFLSNELEFRAPFFENKDIWNSSLVPAFSATQAFLTKNRKRYQRRPFSCAIALDPRVHR